MAEGVNVHVFRLIPSIGMMKDIDTSVTPAEADKQRLLAISNRGSTTSDQTHVETAQPYSGTYQVDEKHEKVNRWQWKTRLVGNWIVDQSTDESHRMND